MVLGRAVRSRLPKGPPSATWPRGPGSGGSPCPASAAAFSPATAPCWPATKTFWRWRSTIAGCKSRRPGWLREMARARLSHPQRKDPRQVAADERQVCRQRSELARRLADFCGVPAAEWDARISRVQARVAQIIATAKRRRQSEAAAASASAGPVSEELDYHVMADDVSPAVAAEIEAILAVSRREDRPPRRGGPIRPALGRPCARLPGTGRRPDERPTRWRRLFAGRGGRRAAIRAAAPRPARARPSSRPIAAAASWPSSAGGTRARAATSCYPRSQAPADGRDVARCRLAAAGDAAGRRWARRRGHRRDGPPRRRLLAAASAPVRPEHLLAERRRQRQALLRRRTAPCSIARADGLAAGLGLQDAHGHRPDGIGRVDPQQPFTAKAICTIPTRCVVRSTSAKASATATGDVGRRPGAELQRLLFPLRGRRWASRPLADWARRLGLAGPRASTCPAKRPASCRRRSRSAAWRDTTGKPPTRR